MQPLEQGYGTRQVGVPHCSHLLDGYVMKYFTPMKNKHIIEGDKSSTMLQRATTCCDGFHQTIAGALLGSPEWKAWYASEDSLSYDIDETETVDAMSDEHFASFVEFIRKTK